MGNNWCIKLDDKNRDVVIKYLNEKFRIELCDIELCGDRIYYGVYCNNIYCDDVVLETEINIKQFIEMIKDEGYQVMYNPIMNKFEYVCKPVYSGIKLNNSTNILSTSKNNPPINKFLSELDKDTKEVQSDGGSTQYYQIEITNSNGEKFNCELNDILRDVFNNQWDLCNIVKASRRISESRKGQGKKDVSIQYDANKIIWFAEEIKKYGK